MPLQAIRRHDVESFVTGRLSNGLSASRIGQAYRLLSMILSSAVDNDYLTKNPAASVRLPRTPKREQHFLSASEVSRLVDAAQPEHRTLVLVLAFCGLRWGEAVALRWRRVNGSKLDIRESASEADGKLWFGPTKTYESRSVPLPGFLVDALAHHPNRRPSGLVFTSSRGGPLRGNNWRRRVWHPALERAELPPIRIHDLRHTCAALLVSAGHSAKAIQQHLGHSSITVTMDTYGHLFPEEQDRIAASLDALWGGAHSRTIPP